MKTKNISAKVICTCSYHTCFYIYSLCLKLILCCGLASKYPYKYPKCWNFERHWSGGLHFSLKTPYLLVLFHVKLLSGLFSSCLLKKSGTQCFLLLSFFFFFVPNITAICKNKMPPSSESEMILKELENSHLSYYSVNLTDIFKIIDKYCGKVTSKYRQKSLFMA